MFKCDTYLDGQGHARVAVERLEEATQQVGAADLELARFGIGDDCRRLAVIRAAEKREVVICFALRHDKIGLEM